VLRDPGGAVVGLTDAPAESALTVAWHQLSSLDPVKTWAGYAELFGWSLGRDLDLGAMGRHREIVFAAGERAAGALSDVTARPEVHAHWLFFWPVPSLDRAIEEVRARGGKVLGPMTLPGGARIAACDDPQGAAFGIVLRS
jgi:predicted enzyme related to lactoylglutathione lyase